MKEEKRVIRVQGVGAVKASPDLVVLSFDVESTDFNYSVAIKELNSKVNTLRSDLQKAGIEKEKVKNY